MSPKAKRSERELLKQVHRQKQGGGVKGEHNDILAVQGYKTQKADLVRARTAYGQQATGEDSNTAAA